MKKKRFFSLILSLCMVFTIISGTNTSLAASATVSAKDYTSGIEGLHYIRVYETYDDVTNSEYKITNHTLEMYNLLGMYSPYGWGDMLAPLREAMKKDCTEYTNIDSYGDTEYIYLQPESALVTKYFRILGETASQKVLNESQLLYIECARITEFPKDFTNITFSDAIYTYDGTEKKLEINGRLPYGASVVYTNNKATNAGTYNATAKITCAGYNDKKLNATLTINPKTLTITGLSAESKIYDGTDKATLSGGTLSGKVDSDEVMASIPTEGKFSDKNVGNNKTVTVDTIALSGEKKDNYTLTQPIGLTANIAQKEISVKADDKEMMKNGTMPEFTYIADELCDGDSFTGELVTVADGTETGPFDITQGTLTAGNNYKINFTKGTLTVLDKTLQKADVSAMPEKTYGDGGFTVSVTNDENSDLGKFTFESTNTDVATIDTEGNVTIKNAGETNIIVKRSGNDIYADFENSQKLTVKKAATTVTAEPIDTVYGATNMKVNVQDGYHGTLSYRVTSGDDIISVEADGSVTIKKVGQAKIEVKASGDINYAEAVTEVAVNVNAKEITPQVSIILPEDGYVYDGNEKEPSVVVQDANNTLSIDKDYTVNYNNNINAGSNTAKVIISSVAGGNYQFETIEKEFSIAKAEQTINTTDVKVKFGTSAYIIATAQGEISFETNGILPEGTAFDTTTGKVTAGNVEGKFTVTVKATATDNYQANEKNIEVAIISKDIQAPLKVENIKATYGDEGLQVKVELGYVGTLSYEVIQGSDVVSINNGEISILKVGKAVVRITASGDEDYADISADITVEIAPKQFTAPVADNKEYTYTGLAQSYKLATNDGYDIVGAEQTNANENGYVVKAVLKDKINTCWNDEATDDKEYTFIIKKATVTITADNLKAYIGDSVPTPSYKVSGLVNNEKLQNEPTVQYASTPDISQKGTTIIKVSDAVASDNYNIVYIDGTLTVTKKSTSVAGGGGAATVYYSLSFQTNGGSSIDSLSKQDGCVVNLNNYKPTKEGYTFVGWYADSALKNKVTKVTLTKDTKVHAKWEKAVFAEDAKIILIINNKTAIVNGKQINNDVPPIIVNGRTFTPARFVAEQLGAKVEWNEEKQLVTITSKDTVIELTIGSNVAYVNGKAIQMDTAAFILDGRTFTPARFVAEQLGANVEWNEQTGQVTITK